MLCRGCPVEHACCLRVLKKMIQRSGVWLWARVTRREMEIVLHENVQVVVSEKRKQARVCDRPSISEDKRSVRTQIGSAPEGGRCAITLSVYVLCLVEGFLYAESHVGGFLFWLSSFRPTMTRCTRTRSWRTRSLYLQKRKKLNARGTYYLILDLFDI